jgi:hypothetical protein
MKKPVKPAEKNRAQGGKAIHDVRLDLRLQRTGGRGQLDGE